MKKYLFAAVLLLVLTACFSQQKKKQAENPPTQTEINDMMKEMEEAMEEISPEDKKIMDSMGIKMTDVKTTQMNVSGMSDAQVKKVVADGNQVAPQKDVAQINSALVNTVSNANVGEDIKKIHEAVLSQLSAKTKSAGAELLKQLVMQQLSVANTAAGLWMDGKPTLALYLMGEACLEDPDNTNNLNNYASFLTTCGAEQMAISILSNLARRHPQNSTIYNNLAQAWLGLGDLQRAEKYADSAIRIYAAHPQANMVKCVIEERRGNIPAAIAAAKKGISEAYSLEKDNKLRKLGYKLKSEDLNWYPPMPQDALGLEKFTWPEYPLDVKQCKFLELEWDNFKDNCEQKINELKIKQEKIEKDYLESITSRTGLPAYAPKAIKKLGPTVEDIYGNMSFVFAQELQLVFNAALKGEDDEKLLSEKQELLNKKYKDQIGEGKENPLEEVCQEENKIRTEFLKAANGRLQNAHRQYLAYVIRRTSDLLYYYQYTMWPEQFELAKINAQIAWLLQIKSQRPFFESESSWCVEPPEEESSDSLQHFDDVACQYVSTLNLGVYKITSRCSELVGEFDLKGVKITLKDNAETGKFSGTAIVGISKSVGPTALKGKVTVGGLVEFDNTGITDVGAVAGVAVKSGPLTIAGANVQVTFNTGVSTSGKFLGRK